MTAAPKQNQWAPLTTSLLALVAATSIAASPWELGDDDYSGGIALSQQSTDAIPDEYATKDVQPVLSFRCASDGAVAMHIDWQRFISSFRTDVGFRVDGGDAKWIKLAVDSSNKITLANSTETAALLEHIAAGEKLNVETAPYAEPAVFVNFDIASLTQELQKLSEAC